MTVIEMEPYVLPNEDHEVSKEVCRNYEKNIQILTQTNVVKVDTNNSKTKVTIVTSKGEQQLECEYLLVSVGIKPNSDRINIEKTGVKLNKHGYITVDDRMGTNVEGIYAIGDVTGKLALAHKALLQQ